MTFARTATVLSHLYRTVGAAQLAALPDADLLRRFAAEAGAAEEAFAVLVRRHGPAVWRVCRSTLGDAHDAEDAFQATWLLLATKASNLALRGELGPWLRGVARRVALRARATAARRRRHERRAARPETLANPAAEPDLAAVVFDAVGRLPRRLRATVLLCDLDGLTYGEAADRLGWTHAAVRNCLARGRQRLRVTLAKKGLAPAVVALGAGAAIPTGLAQATTRVVVRYLTGTARGAVSESVLALMNGGLIVTRLKAIGASTMTAAVLIAGAVGLSAQAPPAQAPASEMKQREWPAESRVPPPAPLLADPAYAITRLVLEAQRQEGQDPAAALKALGLADAALRDWQAKVQAAAKMKGYEQAYAAQLRPPLMDRLDRQAAGVEQRLQHVEQKLDRLLDALAAPGEKKKVVAPFRTREQIAALEEMVTQYRERAVWAKRMFDKGFLTAAQLDAEVKQLKQAEDMLATVDKAAETKREPPPAKK